MRGPETAVVDSGERVDSAQQTTALGQSDAPQSSGKHLKEGTKPKNGSSRSTDTRRKQKQGVGPSDKDGLAVRATGKTSVKLIFIRLLQHFLQTTRLDLKIS